MIIYKFAMWFRKKKSQLTSDEYVDYSDPTYPVIRKQNFSTIRWKCMNTKSNAIDIIIEIDGIDYTIHTIKDIPNKLVRDYVNKKLPNIIKTVQKVDSVLAIA